MPATNPDGCPAEPDETAEAYLFEELTTVQAQSFENHFLTCRRCAGVLQETQKYVVAMSQAAQRLRSAEYKPRKK